MIAENERNVPAVASISEMARLLNLSRSRFYQLIEQGVFIPPILSTDNGRPLYRAEMIIRNLEVRRTGIGANGKEVMFYASRTYSYSPSSGSARQADNTCYNSPHKIFFSFPGEFPYFYF